MILIFGGTTEGRKAVGVAEQAGKPYYYSTRGDLQQVEMASGIRLCGAMDEAAMTEFCRANGISLIVDASHPFAQELHRTVSAVGRKLNVPVVRYERRYSSREEDIIWCEDFKDAVDKLREHDIHSLMALTGVQTIGKLRGYWQERDCIFRILKREESRSIAAREGFPEDKLFYYEDTDEAIVGLIKKHGIQAIITKESGDSGGFESKIEAARQCNVRIFAVRRPPLPEEYIVVNGDYGLRKEIERHEPGFFDLRSGFTTGSCATAASKAALEYLLTGIVPLEVEFELPCGETLKMDIESVVMDGAAAVATVIKDAGDDPDVTNGMEIKARVEMTDGETIEIDGGEGVGRITLPGLGIETGGAAINKVPRRMMEENLSSLYKGGLKVVISLPQGRDIASRTFNGRLGIVDGISIIGTSGVVMPFSHDAFINAIRRQVEVFVSSGSGRLVLNSGARSEKAVRGRYPELPSTSFIHYGNAIGETLAIAEEMGVEKVTLGLMLGKGVKLAEGNLDTHSKNVVMNRTFLISLARESGCSEHTAEIISSLNLARELWDSISREDRDRLFMTVLRLCHEYCRKVYKSGDLEVLLISESLDVAYSLQ